MEWTYPLDRTNRSRLYHFELLGFALKNLWGASLQLKDGADTHGPYLEKSTWAAGAMPMGAPRNREYE